MYLFNTILWNYNIQLDEGMKERDDYNKKKKKRERERVKQNRSLRSSLVFCTYLIFSYIWVVFMFQENFPNNLKLSQFIINSIC